VNSPRSESRVTLLLQEGTLSNDQSRWRELAEKASVEQNSEKLMALVEELMGAMSQCEAVARQRRTSASA
jgi:hypothetical protein